MTSSVTTTTPVEADTTNVATEVLATYFVVASIIFGILLFIGVRTLAHLCCFANVFHQSKDDVENTKYNPHTPVPGMLYQLQMAYDKKHGSTHVRPVSRAGSQSSLLQRASQASGSCRSSHTYRSTKRSNNIVIDNAASKASDVTTPIDNIESVPAHYENLPMEVQIDVIKHDTSSVTDSETQTNGTSTVADTPETESLSECGATCSSDSVPPGGARRYKKNATAAGSRPTSRGIPSKVRESLEHS